MSRILKRIAAAALAAGILVTTAVAYQYEDVVTPGEKVGIEYSEFYDKSGNSLESASDFTDKNFAIVKKTISKGANLVKGFKINNRSHEVDITFVDKAIVAPNGPNVIIDELAVRSTRAVKDGSYTIIKSGVTYTFDGELAFRVGMDNNDVEMVRDGEFITLESGETKYIRWIRGDSYGNAEVEYGDLGLLKGRVYENDRVLYGFDDDVHDDLLDRNPNAYIQGLNIKGSELPNNPKLYILANKEDYIYENDEGQLKAVSGLKWSEEDYAWVVTLNKGKEFIISDSKLRSAPYGSGVDETSSNDSYVDTDYNSDSSGSKSNTNKYDNPNTGGGSGTVVAVSAVVAILAIAVVSVIMSAIIAGKSLKK